MNIVGGCGRPPANSLIMSPGWLPGATPGSMLTAHPATEVPDEHGRVRHAHVLVRLHDRGQPDTRPAPVPQRRAALSRVYFGALRGYSVPYSLTDLKRAQNAVAHAFSGLAPATRSATAKSSTSQRVRSAGLTATRQRLWLERFTPPSALGCPSQRKIHPVLTRLRAHPAGSSGSSFSISSSRS